MRTYIFSFLLTMTAIVYLNMPAVMAAPIEVIPRIAVYLAFPVSVFVAMAMTLLIHALGFSPALVGEHKPAVA